MLRTFQMPLVSIDNSLVMPQPVSLHDCTPLCRVSENSKIVISAIVLSIDSIDVT